MTRVYGIFGWPVAHSRSPAMHNAAFAALGIDAVYVPFAVSPERLARAVEALGALEIAGINVTVPHKSAIVPMLARVDAVASAIGAVNTVWREDGALVGGNTDAEGLARALVEGGAVIRGARTVVLGAGGAARASVVGLADAGAARVVIAARRREQAEALVIALRPACASTELVAGALGDPALAHDFAASTLLVQATSATLAHTGGTEAERFAESLPLDALPPSAVVCDLVYQPRRTAVLARAESRGLRTLDGLGMLLHQGAAAFERWTSHAAPLAVMREALNAPT